MRKNSKSFALYDKATLSMIKDIREKLEAEFGKMSNSNAARYCIKQMHRQLLAEKYKEQEENALLH